ncbi:MAG TPA: YihY/virulence factor BrkB family protein [Mycobacteriales bacterium]|nr:YihY/virulence factor BrkB family protein [Mycobacteriales bacterium]
MVDLSGLKARVDAYQRERPWLAFPVAVLLKFGEDNSGNLAVIITYYAFFSVFPLLLALSSVLGFVLAGHPGWQSSIEQSALKNLPLIKGSPLPHHGSVYVAVLGFVLALYSGLAVAKAAQQAWDTVYGVARDERLGFLAKNLRALQLVVFGGLGLVATTAVAGAVTSGSAVGISVGWGLTILGVAVSALLNTALMVLVFRWLPTPKHGAREVLPGAAIVALSLAILQAVASALISHKLQHASATYGSFGTVIVLLSWFYLQAQIMLVGAQVNVVKRDHSWPRSLSGEVAPAG